MSYLRRLSALALIWSVFAWLLLTPASAQTRYIERGVSAGNSPSTFTTTERLFSVTELQTDPGAPLRVQTDNGGAGYSIGREGTALVKRRELLADGVEMSVRSFTGTTAADATAIPLTTLNGQRPYSRSYVLIEKERIDVYAADSTASTARIRIHASLSVIGNGMRSENRIWGPVGKVRLTVSGTIYRRSGNQRISDFGSVFAIDKATTPSGPVTTATSVFGQGFLGATVTPDYPGVGTAGGSGAWNELNEDGQGYFDLNVPNGSYVEFSVTCETSAEIQNFASPQAIAGAAGAHYDISATGRVWTSQPEGGYATGLLGTALRSQNAGFSVDDRPLNSPPFDLPALNFAGNPLTYTLLSGPATLSGRTLTPNGSRGTVELRATQDGGTDFVPASATGSFRLLGLDQTITFPELSTRTADSAAFAPGATSSSGLPVTYTIVSGPATTDGTLVTLTGATGTVFLRASQPGNSTYEAAPAFERSFVVTPATSAPLAQTITFPSLLAAEVGVGQLLGATASSGLPVVYEVIAGDATLGGPNANILTARTAGVVTVRATQAGGTVGSTTYAAAPAVERSFTATAITAPELLEQTITNFNPPAEFTYSDTALELSIYPEASSGLPVTLSVVSGPAEIVPVSGAVRITGPGTVVLRAEQSGDSTYAAVVVERTLLVRDSAAPLAQTIQLNTFLLNLATGAALDLTSPTATSGLPVTIQLISTYPSGIATLSGRRITTTAPGFVTLRLTQAGGIHLGTTYSAAEPVEVTLPVLPRAMRALDLLGAWTSTEADSEATLAVVFAADGTYYHGEAGTDDSNGQDGIETGTYTWDTLSGHFNATPRVDLNGEWGLSHPRAPLRFLVSGDTLIGREGDDYFTLRRVRAATPAIVGAWRVPVEGGDAVVVFFPNGDYLHLETATADDAGQPGLEIGSFTWTAATGRLVATPTLDQNGEWGLSHSAADLTVRLTGNQLAVREGGAVVATLARIGAATAPKSQTITFAQPAARTFGVAPFALTASASSRLPVSFTVVSGSATLGTDGRTLTLTGAGPVVLRATQDGDAAFAPAEPVERTLQVNRAAQRITFAQPAPIAYGNEPVSLIASASSGLPVSFELLPATPAGSAYLDPESGTITAQGPGRVTVRATQPGNANFAPAVAVSRVLEVRPAPPEVPFFSAGDALFVGGQPIRSLATSQPAPATGLRYFSSGLPTGLTLNPTTGTISGTITAKPGNYTVRLWTQAGAIKSATLTTTLTVQAFPATFTGGHEWLLLETGSPRLPWGKLQLQVAATGTFTGTLLTSDAAARTVRGRLTPAGDGTLAQTALATPAGTLAITLAAGETPSVEVMNGDAIFATSDRYLRSRVALDGNAPWAGRYTIALGAYSRVNGADTAALPYGSGYATATVATNGLLKITGTLADGTPLTLSLNSGGGTAYDAAPEYLWFARPHALGSNYVAGWTSLSRETSTTPVRYDAVPLSDHQTVYWKKSPQTSTGAYASGFDPLLVTVRMQTWLPVNAANSLAARLGYTAPLTLVSTLAIDGMSAEDPYQDDGLPPSVQLGANNRFTLPTGLPVATTRAWKLSADPNSGAITGSFLLPGDPATSAAARTIAFKGVLLQPGAHTLGLLTATNFLVPSTTRGGPTVSGELSLSLAFDISGLSKAGSGTLLIDGSNTYTGGTTIIPGSVIVAPDLSAAGTLVLLTP